MKTTIITLGLLLTALATVPVASAATVPGLSDLCETAKCHVEDPPAHCTIDLTTCAVEGVATCHILFAGVSCTHHLSACLEVLWGIHHPDLVVGGHNTCNVKAWTDGGFITVTQPAAAVAAPDCDDSLTWPGGHVTCVVGGRTVGCYFWTGALLLQDANSVACGASGCDGDLHTDGRPVRVGTIGCFVYVQTDAPIGYVEDLLNALTDSVAASPVCDPNPVDTTCTTPVGTCTVFLNRWSYADCETVFPCAVETVTAEMGRLSVYASDCKAGFHLIG